GFDKFICDGKCVDTYSDANNCGACGHVCPAPAGGSATCSGSCAQRCDNSYFVVCGNRCVDSHSDVDNCGSCGHVCSAPAGGSVSCFGICVPACPSQQFLCGNACVAESVTACGSACAVCPASPA